jgi:hypothetical protein
MPGRGGEDAARLDGDGGDAGGGGHRVGLAGRDVDAAGRASARSLGAFRTPQWRLSDGFAVILVGT